MAQVIFIFSAIGLCIAVYSLLHNQGFASGEFCTIGERLNCDVVNKGPYSKIFGIPVAFIGVLGYLFLSLAAGMKWKRSQDKSLGGFLVLASTFGFFFSVYLTNIELFVLKTWCVLCLSSQALIFLIFLCSLWLWHNERKAQV